MKFSICVFFLAVILAVAGCSSTSGAKVEMPSVSVGGESPPATPVTTQEKVSESPVALKNDNPTDTEPNFPDLTEEYGGGDSLEGFNRSMFAVNKFGLRYLVQPLVIFWGSLIPKHGIICINRLTDNIAFPKRSVSALCQAKFKYAGIDTSRFLINVTLGV
ncbi:MAG: MlaA family lipoprotein, partial [Victivallales bacterium]